MRLLSLARLGTLAVLTMPALTLAQTATVSRIVGVFNIFVGLMLTAAIILYFMGFAMWWIRLGSWPSYRTEAIRVMEWSVAVLFTLILLLGIVQFFQQHQQAAGYVLSAIVVILIIWVIVYVISSSGEEKKDAKKH